MIPLALIWLLLISPEYISIQKKFDKIEHERYRLGSRVFLSIQELNAFARQQALEIAPGGVHALQFSLYEDTGTAMARINFLELNKARGGQSNWLMDQLFQGERTVKVVVRIQTRNGQARVDVNRVEVAGAAVEGAALKFLIDHYVIPEFPDVKISKWFPLSYRVDHLDSRPEGITVFIGK